MRMVVLLLMLVLDQELELGEGMLLGHMVVLGKPVGLLMVLLLPPLPMMLLVLVLVLGQ